MERKREAFAYDFIHLEKLMIVSKWLFAVDLREKRISNNYIKLNH